MKIAKKYRVLFVVPILALVLAGCGVPQDQYDAAQSQIAAAQKQYEDTKAQLDLVQKKGDSLQSDLSKAQQERDATRTQLNTAQADIKKLQEAAAAQSQTLAQTQQRVTQTENRLAAVMDTRIDVYYRFAYLSIQNIWTLSVPLKTYLLDKEKARPTDAARYAALVKDADGDALLATLVKYFKDMTTAYDLRSSDVPNVVVKFVQTLPRTNRDVTTPNDSYPRFPLETLFEQTADSEDSAILAAAILSRLGYDVVLFQYEPLKHMAVGVNIPSAGYSWEDKGKRYYYLETTGDNWTLGDCPPQYRDVRPTIFGVTGS